MRLFHLSLSNALALSYSLSLSLSLSLSRSLFLSLSLFLSFNLGERRKHTLRDVFPDVCSHLLTLVAR